jgi:hypothetical protein
MMRRVLATAVCGLGLGLTMPVAAQGDGNPVGPLVGGGGATAPGSAYDYVTVSAGRNTVVEEIQRAGAWVGLTGFVRGSYGVPGVGYGGTGTGLSADRRTLVVERLASASQPKRTTLAVLNARTLRVRTHITLPGYFTVDAVSPKGRWLYLTHYRSFSNIYRYEVLAYDLATRKLLSTPIVDPREPDEKMQGVPLTRTVSPDGRWAYTLYDRGTGSPFIHALDTTGRRAFCIDLPRRLIRQIGAARLALTAGRLRVLGERGRTLAMVDTKTLAAARPPGTAQPAQSQNRASAIGHGGSFPWLAGACAALALVALAGLARRRQRPPSARGKTGD